MFIEMLLYLIWIGLGIGTIGLLFRFLGMARPKQLRVRVLKEPRMK